MMRALLLLSALITTPTMTLADTEAWRAPLVDDFEAQDFSPAGGLYYRDNAEQRAGTVEFQDKEVFAGKGALKLSIKPQCSTAEENCSERAEIWEKTELRVPYNQGIWYGFAVKFADPIPSGDHRYLIAQWKREIDPGADGDFSPFLALRMNNGKLFATVETNYIAPKKSKKGAQREHCSKQQTPVWYRPKTNQMRALVATQDGWNFADEPRFSECTKAITVIDRGNKLPSPASGWIQFAIFTKPDANGNGRIELDRKSVV